MTAKGAPLPLPAALDPRGVAEPESLQPSPARRCVLKVVCALFAVLLLWATLGQLDIVAVAQGRLVPETAVKIVQPAEAGVVRELLVREGDAVDAGVVLVRLDPTLATAEGRAVAAELDLQRLQLRRIEAELTGVPLHRQADDDALWFPQVEAQGRAHRQVYLDAVAAEETARQRTGHDLAAAAGTLKKHEAALPALERQAHAFEQLAGLHLVARLQAEEKRREADGQARDLESQRAVVEGLKAALRQHDRRLAHLRSTYASDLNSLRVDSMAKIRQLEQGMAKQGYREGLLELRAPQAGIIESVATTTLGAVLHRGQCS